MFSIIFYETRSGNVIKLTKVSLNNIPQTRIIKVKIKSQLM